ncbi:MAG: biotin synthase BioB [Desulfovibrio sp.]
MLKQITEKALKNEPLSDADVQILINWDEENIAELCEGADSIKRKFFGNTVAFCSIINAKSGKCTEDCAFCAQSSFHDTEAPEYAFLDPQEIDIQAGKAAKAGSSRYGIVASGKTMTDDEFSRLKESVTLVRKQGLVPDVSVGILSKERLEELYACGARGLHHNLEVARSFFSEICTTHSYEEDVQAVRHGLECGYYVCSGGIFGLGESWEQRVELALTLKELDVHSVPVNFLHPIAGTRMADQDVLSPQEALKIVALYRYLLPTKHIRVCGGRSTVFEVEESSAVLTCGASGMMVGDYLTTKGAQLEHDRQCIADLDLQLDSADSYA